MANNSYKLNYKTTVRPGANGKTEVVYYKTAIVTFTDDSIELNSGGWWTVSTRNRMNEVGRHFDLGFSVSIKGKKWYLTYGDECHPFTHDEMALNRETGEFTPIA